MNSLSNVVASNSGTWSSGMILVSDGGRVRVVPNSILAAPLSGEPEVKPKSFTFNSHFASATDSCTATVVGHAYSRCDVP